MILCGLNRQRGDQKSGAGWCWVCKRHPGQICFQRFLVALQSEKIGNRQNSLGSRDLGDEVGEAGWSMTRVTKVTLKNLDIII